MNRVFERIKVYGALMTALCILLVTTLGFLTVGQGKKYSDAAESKSTKTITVNGQRGDITDRNGVILATNKKSFSVTFDRDVSKKTAADRALFTESLIKAINIIEDNGGKVADSFNIKMDAKGELYFDFKTESEKTYESRLKQWKDNFYFSNNDYTTFEMYTKLRERYGIPTSLTFDQARKVLSIWQEVQMNAYRSYYDIVISSDVDSVTISELEAQDFYDDCIQISESYVRVYPKGDTASHVLGYVGKQTDEEKIEANEALGYLATDEVGISGIEYTMEKNLTGSTSDKKGTKVVEVNNIGKVIREISSTDATAGDTVMLSIDTQMQKIAEEALEENVKLVREEQERLYRSKSGSYNAELAARGDTYEDLQMAESGCAIVMDVKTGQVLTMASYPDYDPNIFVGGISQELYDEVNNQDGAPLYNKAISRGTPGSTFKMVTAVAGLMEGAVGVNETIDDIGMYTRHLSSENAKGPKCWTNVPSSHANQNVSLAIQNSCNYYFYEVSYRMGVDKIVKWAKELGLTSKTNIELTGELTGQVGDQSVLYDHTKASNNQQTSMAILVKKQISGYIKQNLEKNGIKKTDEEISTGAEKLIQLIDGNSRKLGSEIREILDKEFGIKKNMLNSIDVEISASLAQLQWSANDTITTGIGQGITVVTPIAMARYISALVNGGTVYDATLVKATIDANGVATENQPKIKNTIDIKDEYLQAIKAGMRNVVSHEDGSSSISYFKGWSDAKIKQLAGKTGTSQISQIDIENNSWFVAFAPYDEPEIAIVVYIPNGYSGSRSAYTVEKIASYYLDKKETESVYTLDAVNDVKKY